MLRSVSIHEIDCIAALALRTQTQGIEELAKVRIVKERKSTDYTFVDNSLNLRELSEEKEMHETKKDEGAEPDFRLRDDSKKVKARFKPKIAGGHSKQGHSPVYE